MATYAPPSETLTIFNPDVFLTNDAGDFLDFPVAQGSETFPFGLTTSSLTTVAPTTIDSLVMSDLNPSYKIDYPVNSGRIEFFSNNAVGVSTRGGEIDATGVYTISTLDTIDETAGTLNIGTLAARTGAINIGTGTGTKNITIGNATGTTVALAGSTITASLMSIAGTLSAGASTLTSVITNTLTSSAPSGSALLFNNITTGNVNIATAATGGIVFIGNGTPSTPNTNSVQILSGASGTGELWLGYGGARTIRIGGTNSTIEVGDTTTSTLSLRGSTINATRMAITNALSAGASTLTSVASNTYTGTSMTLTPVTSLAIGGTTSANSAFFNNVGGTTSINGGTATQSIEIGHGQTTGAINIGNITTRSGAITLGFSGATTTLTANAVTINLGDTATTGGIIVGVPFRPNWNAQTYSYTSAEMGYQTTQTPTTTAIATGVATNLTGTFTLGNGVWMIVLRVLVNASASTATAFYRVGLSKTSATFENDRITDFSPNTGGDNYFVTTYIVQSSASQTWYVIGQQAGVTTTIANTNIRVQQTRIA